MMRLVNHPGNVLLTKRMTGLPYDSVANVSLVTAVGREMGLRDLVSKPVNYETLARILARVLQRRRSERPAANPEN